MWQNPPRKGAATLGVGLSLYKHLSVTPENLLFSPYSISIALAMLQVGARGATRREIEDALGPAGTGDTLIESFGVLEKELASRSRPAPYPFHLSAANALWVQSGYQLKPEFVEACHSRLGAEVRDADFAEARIVAVQEVNEWIAEATHDKIREILSESQVDPLTRVLLANAIYFKARWLSPFDKMLTRPEPFHLLDGRRVEVPMMHDKSHYRYARSGSIQALELPYGNDWIVMLVLLPDEGKLGAAQSELDVRCLDMLVSKMGSVDTRLAIPRFRVESSFQLRLELEKLGIETAFKSHADFTGISDEPGFALTDLVHKTFIAVDEYGTEAAAATTTYMSGSALGPPPKPIEFRVDRPFLFLIYDKPTGSVLFMGLVADPR